MRGRGHRSPDLSAAAPGTAGTPPAERDAAHPPADTPRSPGGGASAWPVRVPGGSPRRPRLGFLVCFRLRLGLGVKTRGQELIHRQLRQAPAGPDTGIASARQPGARPAARTRRDAEGPLWTAAPRGSLIGPRLSTYRLLPRTAAMRSGGNVSSASGPRMPRASQTSAAGPASCPAPHAGSAVLQPRFLRSAGGRACARPRCRGRPAPGMRGGGGSCSGRFGHGSRAPPLGPWAGRAAHASPP